MNNSLSDGGDVYPLDEVKASAITMYQEMVFAHPELDVVTHLRSYLVRVSANYEGERELAYSSVLSPDQDFNLLIAAAEYIVEHLEEVMQMASSMTPSISVETAVRVGFQGRVNEVCLNEGFEGLDFGGADVFH